MSDVFDDDEPEVTAEEIEQARRLQEALERGSGSDDREIEGLVETARLVGVSRRFELSPSRQQALRTELTEAFGQHARKALTGRSGAGQSGAGQPGAPFLRRFALWFPLPLAAAAALVLLVRQQHAPEEAALSTEMAAPAARVAGPQRGARLEPSPALLRAQAQALAEAFDRAAEDERAEARSKTAPGARSDAEAAPVGGAARAELERELSLHRAGLMAALDAKLR